jgi:hypothetical protein
MQEKDGLYWVAYIMDARIANVPILASPKHQATDQQITQIMQTLAVLYSRPPRVLLLQSGIGTMATDNIS